MEAWLTILSSAAPNLTVIRRRLALIWTIATAVLTAVFLATLITLSTRFPISWDWFVPLSRMHESLIDRTVVAIDNRSACQAKGTVFPFAVQIVAHPRLEAIVRITFLALQVIKTKDVILIM